MPIGSGLKAAKDRTREARWDTIGYRTVTRVDPVFAWVTRYVTYTRAIRVLREHLYVVHVDRFQTANDERTCPECGSQNGRTWERGQQNVPTPPLHVNCRCQVVHDHDEVRRRYTVAWEQRSFRDSISEFKQTGTRTVSRLAEVKGWIKP